jgi:hypothetical protein
MFCAFWAALFLVEKCLILYISIHYHYRREHDRIAHSKEMHTALATLYEASVSTYPVHNTLFAIEDHLIHNPDSKLSMTPGRAEKASKFLNRLGFGSAKKRSFFGDIHYEKKRTHWADFGSPYTVVERALQDSKSAAALATRIWKSFASEGEDKLKAEDIAEVLGPFRKEEAQTLFQTIDENESKDLTLEELVWTVVEVGRVRRNIYQGMEQMNHSLNTFDWILQLMLAIVMIALILITCKPNFPPHCSQTLLTGYRRRPGNKINSTNRLLCLHRPLLRRRPHSTQILLRVHPCFLRTPLRHWRPRPSLQLRLHFLRQLLRRPSKYPLYRLSS